MHKVIQYRNWLPIQSDQPKSVNQNLEDSIKIKGLPGIRILVSEKAILLFGRKGCCMCLVMKRLLVGLGVNPTVYEMIDEADEITVGNMLSTIDNTHKIRSEIKQLPPQFPCVYIGGSFFGGLEKLMNAHITGELIPILKQAGALWL